MSKLTTGAAAAVAVAAARKAAERVQEGRKSGALSAGIKRAATRATERDVHAVTVLAGADEIAPGGRLPQPLAALGPAVDVRMRPAPAERGTEVEARLVGELPTGETGPEAQGVIRRALREAKQLIETGEILLPDAPATTQPTPLNAPLRAVTEHGREGGRL